MFTVASSHTEIDELKISHVFVPPIHKTACTGKKTESAVWGKTILGCLTFMAVVLLGEQNISLESKH